MPTLGHTLLNHERNLSTKETPMAVSLSIDLADATFADLRALVDAARTAGVSDNVTLELEDTTLLVIADATANRPRSSAAEPVVKSHQAPRGPAVGDAAIRSVIDILTGRQDPPRN